MRRPAHPDAHLERTLHESRDFRRRLRHAAQRETVRCPKPLVEIGAMPMLWHIMKIYSAHGLNEFVVCCGYKGHLIKRYFLDFFHREQRHDDRPRHQPGRGAPGGGEPWRVTLADTGLETMTGGRLRRVRDYISDGSFCLTYGDGVSDIDITALIAFHRAQGTLATVTAVQQPGRFGALDFSADGKRVGGFREKSAADGHLINGGFFVCEPQVIDYIEGDATVWERSRSRA